MIINSHRFRNSGGSDEISPEYQAVLDYATANSITLPTSEQQTEDDNHLKELKRIGAWNNLDGIAKLKGTADVAFRLIDWKRLVLMSVSGTAVWDADGLKGNGTNVYLSTGYIPSVDAVNYSQNNASVFYINSLLNDGAGTQVTFGMTDGTRTDTAIPFRSGLTSYFRLNNLPNTSPSTSGNKQKIGLNGLYRETSSQLLWKGSSEVVASNASNGIPATELVFLAYNDNGTKSLFAKDKLGFIGWGASLSSIHTDLEGVLT